MSDKDDFYAALDWLRGIKDQRASLLASQVILVADLREALQDQDQELHQLREDFDRMVAGLETAAAALYAANQAVRAAIPPSAKNLFARMNGGHENIMAYVHRDPDYLTKNGLSTYHTDNRPEPRRKKK